MPALLDKVKNYITETEEIKTEADRLWDEAWSGDLSPKESRELRDKVHAMDDEAAFRELVAYMPKAGETAVSKALDSFTEEGRKLGKYHTYHWSNVRIKTLNLVNMWREELGLEPLDRLPKGTTSDINDCVIARALLINGKEGWRAEISDYIRLYDGDGERTIHHKTPAYAQRLITGFDKQYGGYEDLNIRA